MCTSGSTGKESVLEPGSTRLAERREDLKTGDARLNKSSPDLRNYYVPSFGLVLPSTTPERGLAKDSPLLS